MLWTEKRVSIWLEDVMLRGQDILEKYLPMINNPSIGDPLVLQLVGLQISFM